MNRQKRRIWAIIFAAAMILAFACFAEAESSEGIRATSGTCGVNLHWELDNGLLTITGTGAMANYESSTGTPWEAKKGTITEAVIGEGVTTIGNYAFYGCNKLTSVSLPSTVRSLGSYSFSRTGMPCITD